MPNLAQLSGITPGSTGLSSLMTMDAGNVPTPQDQLNSARAQEVTRHLFNTEYDEDAGTSRIQRTAGFLGAAGIDVVDMVGSAIIPGVERGDVWSEARDMGLNGLADFAARNESGVGLTSGLVTAVTGAWAAEALLAPKLANMLGNSTFLTSTKLWQWGERVLGGAKLAATDGAVAAALNGEVATLRTTVGGGKLLRARIAGGSAKAAVGEAGAALLTHTNEALWSDDESTNIMMAAFGVGLGGGLGALGARFEMRKIANSDAVLVARANASDPTGMIHIREYQPDAQALAALGPTAQYKESANITAFALGMTASVPAGTPANRSQMIRQEQTEMRKQMELGIQKMGLPGIEGSPNSSFNLAETKNAVANKYIVESVEKDPTLFMGLDEIGLGNIAENLTNRERYIEGLKKSNLTEDVRKGRDLERREALGLVSGSWMPDSKELRELGDYVPGQIELKPTSKVAGHLEFRLKLSNGTTTVVNEGGNVKNFGKMGLVDQLKVYEGLNHVMKGMINNGQTFVLPKNANWLQMDMAIQMSKKGGSVDLSTFGVKDISQLEVASLRAKAAEAKTLKTLGYWDRAKLNLPLPSSLERIHDGTSDAMASVLRESLKNPKLTAAEAKQIRTKLLQMSDIKTGINAEESAITGNMFEFNRNKDGVWQPIVTGYASYDRITPGLAGTRHQAIVEQAENKIYRIEQLRKGTYTKELTEQVLHMPEFEASLKIRGLSSEQVTGLQGALDRTLGAAVTRTHRYRDSENMLSTFKVREAVDRLAEAKTNKILLETFEGTQNKLASIPNRGSKALVDSWFSFAGGWDLERGFFTQADGTFGFQLKVDSPRNMARLKGPVTKGQLLENPNTGKPLVVDQNGMEYLLRFQKAANDLLAEKNAVRLSRGMTPLANKPWYVPPPDTKGKIIGLTVDANGNVVPGGAIVAASQEEFESMRRIKLAELDKSNQGHRFYSRNQLESIGDLWDKAEIGWVDPGFVGATKKGQTGTIFGDKVNAQAMENSLQWVVDQVQAITNGAVRSLYDQQLAIARARSATETVLKGAKASESRNIWDEWEATVLGRPLTSVKPGVGTKFVTGTEAVADSVAGIVYPAWQALGSGRTAQWINDVAQRLGISRVKGFRSFKELSDQLGPHTPYANVNEYIESTMRVDVPPTIKQLAPKLNSLSASLLLRWFEFPNAVMNMTGIITNMPSILRSPNTPIMGMIAGANGKKVGVVDSYRILAGGFSDMLKGAKHADWDVMVKNGDTSQSIAELNKQMSLIDSQTNFQKFFGGDKNVSTKGRVPRSLGEAADLAKNKGVDGLISLATDTTESMSRAWAHFVGLRLADANGIVGTEARHSFARDVANQAIANYNPLNKPEMFQTSIGSMFGLFTSYMQQYNQRLFRWAETKDYASIGRQLAMQSTLFGVASVPGFNAMDYIADNLFEDIAGNPEATLVDAIYANYGPMVGSAIAHGGIQEIPTIFGLDSIAIYSRGDANFRAPTLDPTRLMAGMNVLSSVATGIYETGSHIISASTDSEVDFNGRYVSEAIARNLPNRAMKGALTVLANEGQDVDASGQIIAESEGMFQNALRMTGLRTGSQQGQIEAYYANASLRRRLAGRMETLREETRAALRAGGEVDYMGLFNRYVDKGGSPAHFKTWIQEQMKNMDSTRGMKDMATSLRSPNSQLEAWRYDQMK